MRAVGCLLLCATAGCGDEASQPLRLESEHFRYYADEDLPVCRTLLDRMEEHYAAVTPWLGVTLGRGEKIDYHRFGDADSLGETGCEYDDGTVPAGCADGLRIVTTRPLETHELVHAYASLLGRAPSLLEEGLATMLGGIGAAGPVVDASFPIESFFESERFQALEPEPKAEAYGPAAGFSRFLVDRYGREAYLDFYASLAHSASAAEIETAFESSFAEPLAVALEAWRAERPLVESVSTYLYLAECASPALSEDGAELLEEECWQETFPLRVARSFSLADARGAVVRARHAPGASTGVSVIACDGTVHRSLLTYLWPDTGQHELWTDLPAGDYFLKAFAEAVAGADPAVSLDLGPQLITETCTETHERVVPAETGAVAVERWLDPQEPLPESLQLAARLYFDTPRTATFRARAASLTLCRAGCEGEPGAECTRIEPANVDVELESIDVAAGAHAVSVQATPEPFMPVRFTIDLER